MGINEFFTEILGGELRNPRWSWGVIDKRSNRVFLRIWDDEIKQNELGRKAQVYWKHPRTESHGYAERWEQLELVKSGAKCFGIITKVVDRNPNRPAKIASFNADILYELGDISEDTEGFYAQIVSSIPTDELIISRPISRSDIPTQKDLAKFEKAVREGSVKKVTCKVRRRCEELRRRARKYYSSLDGKLRCEICGWYKPSELISGDIVELHHLRPLARLPETGLQQLLADAIKSMVPLCPCCHRIAHSSDCNTRLPFSVDELRNMVPKHPLCPAQI